MCSTTHRIRCYAQIIKIEHAPSSSGSEELILTVEFHSVQARIPFRIFLLNRSRHVLITGTDFSSSTNGDMGSPFSVILSRSERIGFGSHDPEEPELNTDWQSGTSLAIVSLTPVDRVKKTVVINQLTKPFPNAQ